MSVDTVDGLLDAARAWLAQDPDEVTRAELESLIGAVESGRGAESVNAAGHTPTPDDALGALQDRFSSRLAFGTAGLRGALGAGPNRMNRVLVSQAAAGFAAFLLERSTAPSIVVGYDGRINSRQFAIDTVEIMAGAGVRALLLPRMLPTPVLAFAVRHFGVSAGVMVTASHNPAADNGYKVYLGGDDAGSQIVAPVDAAIAEHILSVASSVDIASLARSSDFETVDDAVVVEYVGRTAELAARTSDSPAPVSFAYTAMHGVGWETSKRVFAEAGLGEPRSVLAQQEPDAAFPTVAFPNPEEPGALDLAFAEATRARVQLVVAHDPDADRLAVAIPAEDGGWRRLSGNEVGSLLGWRAAERAAASGVSGALACSLVSSPALGAIARAHGLDSVETLTGFKWISRTPDLVFGYEEALGYLVDPGKVRDKDGISAAVDLLALANELAADGRTIADRIVELAERFGGYASSQISVRVTDLADISRIMTRVRTVPPREIAGHLVDRVDDFADGFEAYPPSDILRFWLVDGSRVIVRPSGTEPKVKVYIDAASTAGSGAERLQAAQVTVDQLDAGVREILA
ncbi:phospho-sugar mutase [Marisediminicola sp. LYQ134]|uniref:phospho-sugar mutase n=1 Tax=Marisediminicola sp. LYQ134 TaxID=3391061 RepID=UPI0039834CD2